MILELMAYTVAVSLLVGVATLMLERAVAAPAWPRRWLWAVAMTLSVGGSTAMLQSAHLRTPKLPEHPTAVIARPPPRLAPWAVVAAPAAATPLRILQGASLPDVPEASLKGAWAGASSLLLAWYACGVLRLWRARRGWKALTVNGYSTLIAADVGPAVIGFRRPMIVLPQWLLEGPAANRDIALAHEQEHIAARDPGLLLAALLLLVLTPWNLPLWWQLRRLKLAIEVDCDRRVLHRGVDRRQYANTLLQINQQMGRMPLAAIAIVGRVSQIEQRIATMVAKRPGNIRLWIAGWAAAAIPLLVAAAEITPPASAPITPHAVLGVGVADFDINGAARAVTARHAGAMLTDVRPGSAAEQAGLKRGDIVQKYGNTSIAGMTDLVSQVARTAPDASVDLVILRGPEMRTSVVTVHFSPSQPPLPQGPGKIMDASDWDTLRDASLPIQDRKLAAELIRISGLDLLQAALQNSWTKYPPLPPDTSAIVPSHVNSGTDANVRRLKAIIAEHGWPTVSMVGIRGSSAAALIASGSRSPEFKAEVLALMEPLIQRDEVSAFDYSRVYDDVHTPQRFGTQMTCENGLLKPTKPVEDPDHLEERRSALGLIKLPQYCRTSS
jgi:hypothetical protein